MTSAAPKRDQNGTWSFVVDRGPSVDGKRRQARRRGFKTKREAQEALDALRVANRSGAYVAPTRQTLQDFLINDWLEAVKLNLEPSTWDSYRQVMMRHVVPRIGGIQLRALDAANLNKLYADLSTDGGRADNKPGGLSPRTVRYVHTILGKALRDATRWGRIVRSPADLADPPRASDARPPEMKTWSGEEVAHFLDLERERGSRYRTSWLVLATTGMRRGEACGLRWSDLDLDAGRASIRQTIVTVNHKPRMASRTKTGRARVIDLDPSTVDALRSWRKTQAAEKLLMGAGYDDHDLVLCHPDGRPFHPDRFSREFERRVERYGMKRIRLHDLRHTWATLALEAGVHPKVVQERLGHASVMVTLDMYSHVTAPMRTQAANLVAGKIFGAS